MSNLPRETMVGWTDAARAAILRDFILLLFAAALRDFALRLHVRNKKRMWSSTSTAIITFPHVVVRSLP